MSTPSSVPRTKHHPLDPHLSRVRADLAQLTDDIRWVQADAYWPTRTDPLEPTGHTGPTAEPDDRYDQVVTELPADPDAVPGARYAIGGGGDDASRAALDAATTQLQRLEFHLAAAVFNTGRPVQPALHKPDHTSPRPVIDAALTACAWRIAVLDEDGPGLGRADLTAVRHHLRAARTACDRAIRSCARTLGRGATTGVAHREKPCRVCTIRPQAEREHQVRMPNGSRATVTRASKGGRCDTCATWFTRNGSERPRALDSDAVDDALAAATRRRARGEGWGSS